MSRSYFSILLVVSSVAVAFADQKAGQKEVDVAASATWVDSGLDVTAGDSLAITASGTVEYLNASATPDGLARGWKDLMAQLPVNSSGKGALVGRFGDSPAARPFLIGAQLKRTCPISARLFLSINQMTSAPGSGSYHVVIMRTAAPAAANTANQPISHITQSMLDQIPLRVNDAEGNAGDRVNFVLVGTEEKVQAAFREGGWVTVDKTKKVAVLHGLIASLTKEAYVTLPMSELELFGRVQDYGYAQGDPLTVVASRHHFRLWRCPFTTPAGDAVWAGAGTHDIGFDRDDRNNGVTHKIDPATDGERGYVGESLQQTGLVAKEEFMTPKHPVTEARTATGSGFTSDGRTLVIYLR